MRIPGAGRSNIELLPYPTVWARLGRGAIGNLIFFVGSALFVWDATEVLAIWLFIVGSFGMLLGAIGQAFYTYERHRLNGAPGSRTGAAEHRRGVPQRS